MTYTRIQTLLPTPYGYMARNGGWHAYVNDFQGNIVAVITEDANGRVEVVQQTAYYPDGVVMAESTGRQTNRYLYGGKQIDTRSRLSLYDFTARTRHASLPTFHTLDPLAEKYYHLSPYTYCAGDPLNFIDPTGCKVTLYCTQLPSWFGGILPVAVHSFIVVENNEGKQYYAYGPNCNGKLSRQNYNQDINIYEGKADLDKLIGQFEIQPPDGMSQDEWDNKVIAAAESFSSSDDMSYFIIPLEPSTGNCNSSTYTILKKAGASNSKLNEIGNQMGLLNCGWGNEKRWNKEEMRDLKSVVLEFINRMESLQNSLH